MDYIDLPAPSNSRGDLNFAEGRRLASFEIAPVYFLYNLPVDSERVGYSHKNQQQMVYVLSGSFRITVDDSRERREFWLRDPRKGLYISRNIPRKMDAFSQGAVYALLASQPFVEDDYCRDYGPFKVSGLIFKVLARG